MKKITGKQEKPVLRTTKRTGKTTYDFPIVGIGASAGGLEALEQFFAGVEKDTGFAFVVIQHLDPNHIGIMPELIQRTTNMKVSQATDHMQVKPNNVYIIPPNKSMSILKGYLHLFEPTEIRGLRLPIDIFFRSLADDMKEKSIGIILSGMGSDGSLGLKAIKEKNGLVLVQDPLTAKFNSMPNCAIEAVNADIIAPVNELPSKLVSLLKYLPPDSPKVVIDDKSISNIEKIIILIRSQTGHNFAYYKKNTLFRRIERRMSVHQINKIANYVRFLQENPTELDILYKELLIGVTRFFRDPPVWDKLRDTFLSDILNLLPHGYILRVWITGCSTGEEAFSFAIVFKEACEKIKNGKNLSLQIFATDLDNDAIERARKGTFNSNITADVSPERLSRYFTFKDTKYIVNSSIRELIVFAPHDVIKDPPFTKLDFLLCRNLLIYMESELQKKLINLFYYSLNPDGTMLLGSAENINSQDMLFSSIDNKLKFYKRSATPVQIDKMNFPNSVSSPPKRSQEDIKQIQPVNNIQAFADQLILSRFAPSSVLINHEGDILYITGKTGKYLEPAAGKANMNIYAMAREGLGNELMIGIRKASQSYEPVLLNNISISDNRGTQLVNVTIQRNEKPDAFKGTLIIVFTDVSSTRKPVNKKSGKPDINLTSFKHESEIELQRTLEELQSTREEMQTSQEELRSANEELQSANEELQSTNEELTTSKEEMQSLNEELQTVNIELQTKMTEFMETNNDMKNLLNSTDIATLFLDKELKIRRFTDQVTKLFKLRASDIGRPFTDLVSDLQYNKIADDAREVIRTLMLKEIDITTRDNKWFTVRIMPYRTLDDRINGLVMTFIDITVAKKLEAELKGTIKILKDHNIEKA
jgi:two-component system CheB/CheR fusion protein